MKTPLEKGFKDLIEGRTIKEKDFKEKYNLMTTMEKVKFFCDEYYEKNGEAPTVLQGVKIALQDFADKVESSYDGCKTHKKWKQLKKQEGIE